MRTSHRYSPELEELLYVKRDPRLSRVVIGIIVLFAFCAVVAGGK